MNPMTTTVYSLAEMAGVGSPDWPNSPGAVWLEQVYEAFVDQDWEDVEPSDTIHELADDMVPVYTHERWRIFTDLAAYQEDVTELLGPITDLTQAAGVALYMVAHRLLTRLLEEEEDATI